MSDKKAWVITADMGYGHQRAAYPLKDIAYERIISANSDKVISKKEKKTWQKSKTFYEWISRINDVPFVGKFSFRLFDKFIQRINPFYPLINSPRPTLQVKFVHRQIEKGLGKSLITYIKNKKIPLVTTFYLPSLTANYYGLKNNYCVITDTDINRIWVPLNPETNTINYFVPCEHAYKRLISYGIKPNNLFLTGFPLPKENIGGINSPITKEILSERLIRLDPTKRFINLYAPILKNELGKHFNKNKKPTPVNVTFVTGGAGAQKEIGVQILKSLKKKLKEGTINYCLIPGTHLDIKEYFLEAIEEEHLTHLLGKNLSIISKITKKDYFSAFNEQMNKTDVLWTKPSELSFYAGLGIPIIIAPTLGEQEKWNRSWLLEIGAGTDQLKPEYFSDWLDEWLDEGLLARKAWNGYLYAPRLGTYNIERILFEK